MNDEQLLRYSRHIMLPGMDFQGQQRLLDAHALIIGLGGLGCPVSLYLASSGVGKLTLVDDDLVDLANLQRQIAYRNQDIGKHKAQALCATLDAINPDVETLALCERIDGTALERRVADAHVVIDASDNFVTRFAINRACIKHRKPLVSGAAAGGDGQLVVFDSRDQRSPCYRCLYQERETSAPRCSETGVLAALTGVIGSLQALEALKLLSGYGKPAIGLLSILDGQAMSWRQLHLPKDPACPDCGDYSAQAP